MPGALRLLARDFVLLLSIVSCGRFQAMYCVVEKFQFLALHLLTCSPKPAIRNFQGRSLEEEKLLKELKLVRMMGYSEYHAVKGEEGHQDF